MGKAGLKSDFEAWHRLGRPADSRTESFKEEQIMNLKGKKLTAIFCLLCILSLMAAGCGAAAEEPAGSDAASSADTEGQEPSASSETGTEAPEEAQDSPEGRWHVLEPEVAAAIDADFSGTVWKMEEDAFYIVEEKVMLEEDGSIISSSPSSGAEIPDSDLIEVVFDEDTYFYMRTVQGDGASHEDTDAGFSDLEKGVSVELKGYFEKDVFHAEEIRIVKVS